MKTIEYQGIKSELMYNHQKQDSYITIAYTATIAVWTIALTVSNAWVAIAPMLFLIPISMRISYCRYSIALLGSYLAIFFEGKGNEGWEYRREKYYNVNRRSKSDKMIDLISKWDIAFLSSISAVLFWTLQGFDQYTLKTLWIPLIIIFFQFVIVFVTVMISWKYSNVSIPKKDMMQKWKTLLDEENRENEDMKNQ